MKLHPRSSESKLRHSRPLAIVALVALPILSGHLVACQSDQPAISEDAGYDSAPEGGTDAPSSAEELAWRDDFDVLDADESWLIQLYSFDASGCNFVPEMLVATDSILRITVEKNTRADLPKAYNGGDMGTNTYRSYGLYRVRMKPCPARGTVTAFYIMNQWQPVNWEHKEIDIEFLGKDRRNIQLTTHDFQQGGTVWKSSAQTLDLGFDWSADFHEYAILWTATEVKWFADGKLLRATSDYVPHEPLQIRANLYAGDTAQPGILQWLGPVHDEDLPSSAEYDWVSYTPLDQIPDEYR